MDEPHTVEVPEPHTVEDPQTVESAVGPFQMFDPQTVEGPKRLMNPKRSTYLHTVDEPQTVE